MRILWLSNPPWVGSGYGEQTGLFVERLGALGHQMACAANFGLHSVKLDWNGLTVYPADHDWGNKNLPVFAAHHKADLVIALCDAWVLKPDTWPDGLPVAVWAPVDHNPIPPPVAQVLAHPQVRPVAMSRFGETQMAKFGLDPVYVPHGVDTRMFHPQPEIRDEVRAELGIPQDAYVVGMVAANKGAPISHRKSFPQAFLAFARFAEQNPDAFLYVHTDAKPGPGGGIDLDTLVAATGCRRDRVMFTPEHQWQLAMPNEYVAVLYQAFDVLLSPSMGEGFGIPILEAQACGIPVIASDHSAMTELVEETGWLVEGDPWWDGSQSSWFIAPFVKSIVEQLEVSYAVRNEPAVRQRCVELAQRYDAERVTAEHWLPALEKLQRPKQVAPPNGVVKLNRKQRRKLAKATA